MHSVAKLLYCIVVLYKKPAHRIGVTSVISVQAIVYRKIKLHSRHRKILNLTPLTLLIYNILLLGSNLTSVRSIKDLPAIFLTRLGYVSLPKPLSMTSYFQETSPDVSVVISRKMESGLQAHAYVLTTKFEMVLKFTVCALFCF